jgi:hypothetical protein
MTDELKKDEICEIYGIDTNQPVTPLMARDALVKCFQSAHAQELEELKDYGEMDEQEFARMKDISVETLIKNFFTENKDDFNAPTKDSLIRAIGKLASFAQKFRNQEIVKQHYGEMMKVMEKVQ